MDEALEAALAVELDPPSEGPIRWQQPRTRALVDLGPLLCGPRLARATAAALELGEADDQAAALAALAPRLAESGEVGKAFEAVAAAEVADGRDNPWPKIVPQLQNAKDVEAAFNAVQVISEGPVRAEALAAVAARLAELGQRERGLAVAQSIDHTWYRLEALSLRGNSSTASHTTGWGYLSQVNIHQS